MATKLLELEAIVSWAKVFEHNRDVAANASHPGVKDTLEKCDGQYSIEAQLEKSELDKVSESGARTKPNLTDDGITMRFKRKHKHPGGIDALGGPPRVVDADDNDWDENVLIGNGSKALVYVSVYDTSMGKGARLEAVKVLDLVEFERDESEESSGIKLPF